MTSLWTPGAKPNVNNPSIPTGQYSELTSAIELHDSEILKIEDGPLAWANAKQKTEMTIDQFVKDLTEQFAQIGLGVEVQVFTTQQAGTWAFKIEIQRRLGSVFDPDRQVHEVVNNILDIPGQEGWINTGKAMMEHAREQRGKAHRHG